MTMKFRAHDTFFIRKGWLSKGMERVVAKEDLFVDKNENPMDVLGIGSNMVKALELYTCFNTSLQNKLKKQRHGISSLMSFQCQSLQGRNLYKGYRIIY